MNLVRHTSHCVSFCILPMLIPIACDRIDSSYDVPCVFLYLSRSLASTTKIVCIGNYVCANSSSLFFLFWPRHSSTVPFALFIAAVIDDAFVFSGRPFNFIPFCHPTNISNANQFTQTAIVITNATPTKTESIE